MNNNKQLFLYSFKLIYLSYVDIKCYQEMEFNHVL